MTPSHRDIARLHQDRAALRSRLGFLDAQKADEITTLEQWHRGISTQGYRDEFIAYEQKARIFDEQASKLRRRFHDIRYSFMRFFVSSKVGFNVARNGAEYCPGDQSRARWDPVLACWLHSTTCHAAHLYPWAQVHFMDDTFGKGSSEENFAPCNGLFLDVGIEKALDKGWLAIVPDVNFTLKQSLPATGRRGGKKGFVFRSSFWPRARYVWWAFLSAILKQGWQRKADAKDNSITQEVIKANRYWETRGRYVKRNMLLGLVEELGQDVESILENAIDPNSTAERGFEGLAVVAEGMIPKKTVEDEDDSEDNLI
ncbi:hypothetical protein GGR54DRAFT_651821 [Hypoxylon sp. NC1633]|nr:hypothetical protein GGR54DRAFT_651821 [Hypoxylon sp. NC1633]